MKRRIFIQQFNAPPAEIEAEIVGAWAVHPSLLTGGELSDDTFRVTYVPVGCNVPCFFVDIEDALLAAGEIDDLIGRGLRDAGQIIARKAEIMALCLRNGGIAWQDHIASADDLARELNAPGALS